MNAGLRSARQMGLMMKQRHRPIPRSYSTTTTASPATTTTSYTPNTPGIPTAVAGTVAPTEAPSTTPENSSDPAASKYRIASAVVLSRPPMLTPDLTPFEESFYFYQRRLNQRLALPFTRYFYFKTGTPADAEWKRKQKALANKYTGFGPRSWADELLAGDDSHKSEDNGYRRLVETTVTGENSSAEGGVEKNLDIPLPRRSKADETGDLRGLDRAMTRTLYLLVQGGRRPDRWGFPISPLIGNENLKEAAERTLKQAANVNMNTWFVGNVPIGHTTLEFAQPTPEGQIADKVFFMKARIMAGQVDLRGNTLMYNDFMWLTKEEIAKYVGAKYYNAIQPMLVSQ